MKKSKNKKEELFTTNANKVFAWLQFSESRAVPFFTGSQAFHIGNIKAHARSHKHKTCYAAKQQRTQQEKGLRDIVQALRQMATKTEEKMEKLFNISVDFLLKRG